MKKPENHVRADRPYFDAIRRILQGKKPRKNRPNFGISKERYSPPLKIHKPEEPNG